MTAKVAELGVETVALFVSPDRAKGALMLGFDPTLVGDEDGPNLPELVREVFRRLVTSNALPPLTASTEFEALWHHGTE